MKFKANQTIGSRVVISHPNRQTNKDYYVIAELPGVARGIIKHFGNYSLDSATPRVS